MIELITVLKWPLIILQGLFSLVLIILVLLQAGKGDDMGSALSGQMGGGVQGTGGTSKVLVKGTVIFAILFMVNTIVLGKIFKELSQASFGVQAEVPLVPDPSVANAIATNAVVGNVVVGNHIEPAKTKPSPSAKPSKESGKKSK